MIDYAVYEIPNLRVIHTIVWVNCEINLYCECEWIQWPLLGKDLVGKKKFRKHCDYCRELNQSGRASKFIGLWELWVIHMYGSHTLNTERLWEGVKNYEVWKTSSSHVIITLQTIDARIWDVIYQSNSSDRMTLGNWIRQLSMPFTLWLYCYKKLKRP